MYILGLARHWVPVGAVATLAAGGCSLILDLEARTCVSSTQCSPDGSMMCMQGRCELAVTSFDDATSDGSGGTDPTETSGPDFTGTTMGGGSNGPSSTTWEPSHDDYSSGDPSGGSMNSDESTTGDEMGTTVGESTGGDSDSGGDETTDGAHPDDLFVTHTFESGLGEWVQFGYGGILSASTDVAYRGTGSARVSGRLESIDGLQNLVTSRIVEGVSYDVSAWVRLGAGAGTSVLTMTCKVVCAGADAEYRTVGATSIRDDEWRQVRGVVLLEEGCDPSEVAIYFEGAAVGTAPDISYATFYIDDAYATPRE